MSAIKERVARLLRAGAIGDAMGYLVEFDNSTTIQKQFGNHGITGTHLLDYDLWAVSDDTQMTLFYLESLLSGEHDSGYKAFQRWYVTQSHYGPDANATGLLADPMLYARQAPGVTCMSALATKECFDIDRRANDSKGCGSIMRTMPSILVGNTPAVFAEACLQSARTHGHALGMLASGWFAVFLDEVHHKKDISVWLSKVTTISEHWCSMHNIPIGYHHEMLALTHKVLEAVSQPSVLTWDALTDTFGEGWIAESAYALALYAGLKADTFEHALQISINHNGDSDSTGSLAAQVYAALHGDHIIHERLYTASVNRLDVKDAIYTMVLECGKG